MRLWTLHPEFLDAKGLVALWREGLLAQKVLRGETKGYKNHPQLNRFKAQNDPATVVCHYLYFVCQEAWRREYNFDINKISQGMKIKDGFQIPVQYGQVEYEMQHLLDKLKVRDRNKYEQVKDIEFKVNPIFFIVNGGVEEWEKI
jgi:hypothetical protein